MKSADKLMHMLCTELDEIAEKGEMSAGDLDTVYKLIVAKEKLLRTQELETELGYSQYSGAYSNAYSGLNGGLNSGLNSGYSGRHYVRGHYSHGTGSYSMADGKEMLMNEIQEVLGSPGTSPADRIVLEKAMGILNR